MRYRYCSYYGAEWEENAYNESLKYPRFKVQQSNPRTIIESTQLMAGQILEARIRDAIADELCPLRVFDDTERIGPCVAFKISNQDLELPFQQVVAYYIKPAIHAVYRQLKSTRVDMFRVQFNRMPTGLLVSIYIYE